MEQCPENPSRGGAGVLISERSSGASGLGGGWESGLDRMKQFNIYFFRKI